MSLLPSAFLFRYSIPVSKIDRLPKAKAPLLKLPKSAEVAFPSAMDGIPQFASLRLAWNKNGLAISVSVQGKSDWANCSIDSPLSSDGVQIWLDTRNTQNIHRASRYCHQFCLLPLGEGDDGMQPFIKQYPVARASEDAPEVGEENVLLESEADESGYTVSAWFPTNILNGFDPEAYSQLGFYIAIHDSEFGKQTFTVGDDFPYQSDPSLWSTLELV